MQTPPERQAILDNFRKVAEGLDALQLQYRQRGQDASFVVEARLRANQLRYVLERFIQVESQHRALVKKMEESAAKDPKGHAARGNELHQLGYTIEFYGEAFYFFAWRMREVVRKVNGLRTFEALGVRNVRNWLIEHADKPGGVMARSFEFDCPQGFILKRFGGPPNRKAIDQGLFPNAQEFVSALVDRLDRLLSHKVG